MEIEQFVMAYGVEQDRLRAFLPDGFISLRPVLRINAEVRDGKQGYLELNTPVGHGRFRGWLNIDSWLDVPFQKNGKTTTFDLPFLQISFTGTGTEGSCPAEKDNDGCYFLRKPERIRPVESITVNKEYCDCRFQWSFSPTDAQGASTGKTLPAYPSEIQNVYPKESLTAENAAKIPCRQVLGSYTLLFTR